MRKLIVNVTKEEIEKAERKNSRTCMIAAAIKRDYPDLKQVWVDIQMIRVTDSKKREQLTFITPRIANEQIVAFDDGEHVQPFSFKCTRPLVRGLREVKTGTYKGRLIRKGQHSVKPRPKTDASAIRLGHYRIHGLGGIGRTRPDHPETLADTPAAA
jgi:hypothetical protein